MIVKLLDGPVQVTDWWVNEGVIVMVEVIGDVPALTAVKEGRLPFPLAASPIVGSLLVHEYELVPPVLVVVKVIAADVAVLQTTTFAGWVT